MNIDGLEIKEISETFYNSFIKEFGEKTKQNKEEKVKENIYDETVAFDLVAHIGSKFGTMVSAQGYSLYFSTKGDLGCGSLEVDLEDKAKPVLIYDETLEEPFSNEEHQKILNLIGYCIYHKIEFFLNGENIINR